VERIVSITGASVSNVPRLAVVEGRETEAPLETGAWMLQGTIEPDHHLTPLEQKTLDVVSPPLARPEAKSSALIPIRKARAWWRLPHDERRAIFDVFIHDRDRKFVD
jgi:hypothetical protein